MMLDIIVPHYKEPFEIGKPFFDMLALQKGVDFSLIRVLLIHDGSELFPEETFSGYPYKVEQHRIAHRGVSAARNFGMDIASAKWISFCDFDDTFSDIYSLKFVMDTLDNDQFDLLWNPIYMEAVKDGHFCVYPLMKFNMIFVHNKYIRLDALRETKLRFNENLSYSEDSAFLAVLNELIPQKRIGEIRSLFPLYTWTHREGSCTTDKKNLARNITHLFDSNRYIAKEFERLNSGNADLMKFRAVCDAYFALTSDEAPKCPELEKRVADFWKANKAAISKCDRKMLNKVYLSSKKNTKKNKTARPEMSEWLKEIGKADDAV